MSRRRAPRLPASPRASKHDMAKLQACFLAALRRGRRAFTMLGDAGVIFEVVLIRDRRVEADCAWIAGGPDGVEVRFNDGEEVLS